MKKRKTMIKLISLIGFVLLSYIYNTWQQAYQTSNALENTVQANFAYCIDGDTVALYVAGETTKIRFQGINTPENSKDVQEPFGKEAAIYTCNKIKDARRIEVLFDKSGSSSYDREVGVVFLNGENLSLQLVEDGLADLKYLKKGMPFYDEYHEALALAKKEHVGRWQ